MVLSRTARIICPSFWKGFKSSKSHLPFITAGNGEHKALTTSSNLWYPRGVRPKVQRSKQSGYVEQVQSWNFSEEEEKGEAAKTEEETELHKPVMLEEIMSIFQPSDNQVFLDMTFGAGGHTKAILQSNPLTKVYALDRDPVAHRLASKLADKYKSRVFPLLGRFTDLDKLLKDAAVQHQSFDGVLIDAGCSSMQFDNPERGFALSEDGPLDMRMDGSRVPSTPSAADVVNNLDAQTLARIIRTYGEERPAKKIGAMIVDYREKHKPIETTEELATVISFAFTHRAAADSKDSLGRKLHVATRTFQALRIFVNDELNELHHALHTIKPYLKIGGKLAVLTFHSLEDRIVKRFLQGKNVNEKGKSLHERKRSHDWTTDEEELKSPDWQIVNKKVLCASEFEVSQNPRSRSAKLRAAFKL